MKFTNRRDVRLDNYTALPEVHLRQMARAATLGFGAEYSSALEFLEQTGDGDAADGGAELWDVVDDAGVVRYQAWVYLADTCSVFVADTDRDSGVGMSQWSFDVHAEPATEELAQELQTAFDALRA